MINHKNIGPLVGVLLAAMYASLIAVTLHRFWPRLHIALILLIFAGFGIGFYFAGIWAAVDRPAELNRKFPISSKELRRRKKAFFDWLDSQGRH